MVENRHDSPDQPPFDENTQWSGPAEADPRDPVTLGQILKSDALAPVTNQQRQHNVREAESTLQKLLDNPASSSEQIREAMELLEQARSKEADSPPLAEE